MLIDNVKIYVRAGDGGAGAVTFRREKYVPNGGPDGGDGGCGGNIVLRIENGVNTLLDYKNHRKFVAGNGGNGSGGKIHGATADDIVLPVPPGTVVRDAESGKVIIDMTDREPFVLCKGGRGGWGNRHFATPTRQIPRFAKSGMKGEEREVIFELKMIADVGIIGLPNVGKSTLLSVISAAKPKIADYNFTTLSPNLGVVNIGEGRGFVAADIPGLIEGASEGLGLGHDFLRHIDRCRLFIHVADLSGVCDPVESIETINAELRAYSVELGARPQIIAANKIDCADENALEKLTAYAREKGVKLCKISAATRAGVDELVHAAADMLKALPCATVYEPEFIPEEPLERGDHSFTVKNVNGVYVVESEWLYNVMGSVNFEDRDSLRYFQRILKSNGIIAALEEKGCEDGDTVSIYDFEFDFVK